MIKINAIIYIIIIRVTSHSIHHVSPCFQQFSPEILHVSWAFNAEPPFSQERGACLATHWPRALSPQRAAALWGHQLCAGGGVTWRQHDGELGALPSGQLTVCYGKSPFLIGKSTISMAIFNSYGKLPEGKPLKMCAWSAGKGPKGPRQPPEAIVIKDPRDSKKRRAKAIQNQAKPKGVGVQNPNSNQ